MGVGVGVGVSVGDGVKVVVCVGVAGIGVCVGEGVPPSVVEQAVRVVRRRNSMLKRWRVIRSSGWEGCPILPCNRREKAISENSAVFDAGGKVRDPILHGIGWQWDQAGGRGRRSWH